METPNRSFANPAFRRLGKMGFEFDPRATEVAILDRSGQPVWKKSKGEEPVPIRWTGMSDSGQVVQTGDYICKIVYQDDRVAYLPFVFVKKD